MTSKGYLHEQLEARFVIKIEATIFETNYISNTKLIRNSTT